MVSQMALLRAVGVIKYTCKQCCFWSSTSKGSIVVVEMTLKFDQFMGGGIGCA